MKWLTFWELEPCGVGGSLPVETLHHALTLSIARLRVNFKTLRDAEVQLGLRLKCRKGVARIVDSKFFYAVLSKKRRTLQPLNARSFFSVGKKLVCQRNS